MTNKQLRTINKLAIATTLVVALAALTVLNVQFASAVEDHEITTVKVLPSTGGTTSLAVGDHNYANNTELTITATPDVGYEFLYWNITGIMNTGGDHDSMDTDPDNMGHGGPFGELSDLDSLILTTNSVTVKIDCAYTYQYEAFFAPDRNATPTATSNTSAQALGSSTTTYLAIGLIGGVAAIAAVAGFYLKRKKQGTAVQINPQINPT